MDICGYIYTWIFTYLYVLLHVHRYLQNCIYIYIYTLHKQSPDSRSVHQRGGLVAQKKQHRETRTSFAPSAAYFSRILAFSSANARKQYTVHY